jgi:hypothetical protein
MNLEQILVPSAVTFKQKAQQHSLATQSYKI